MNKMSSVVRRVSFTNTLLRPTCLKLNFNEKSTKPDTSSSSSSSSSDDELKTKNVNSKSDAKFDKLNSLLKALVEKDEVIKSSNIMLAKPPNKRLKRETGTQSSKKESAEKKMVKAVKDVANEIGGDVKQTESELLTKLLNPETSPTGAKNLTDIVKGMKVEKEATPDGKSRAEQVRSILQQVKGTSRIGGYRSERQQRAAPHQKLTLDQKIDLFGSKPLGIFTDPSNLKDSPESSMWHKLNERELKLSVTHPPANYFQQMILWTEQGKLWKFPIDNEQDLDEEKKVYFAKHIFLEEHLEPWCPPKGPIRHFMELVCVGLSKNSYLTVDAKIEHIEWYKNYFEDKKKLLQETGAIPNERNVQKSLE